MTGRTLLRIKSGAILALLVLTAWPDARAFRPYAAKAEAKTSWMNISSSKSGGESYIEVSADGVVVNRVIAKNSVVTRRGVIKAQLAKDFFREVEGCDLMLSQRTAGGKLVLYKGDMLRISAYISGEIRRIEAPLNNFGEAFSYALKEVKKAAVSLPTDNDIKDFLMAEPLEGVALEEYRTKAAKETGAIEAYDIRKIKPLLKAIKQPYRLIPLEEEDEKEIQAFITTHGLNGRKNFFYLPSTRGAFKCRILDA